MRISLFGNNEVNGRVHCNVRTALMPDSKNSGKREILKDSENICLSNEGLRCRYFCVLRASQMCTQVACSNGVGHDFIRAHFQNFASFED